MEKLEFSWYDYGMFGLTLALSTIIGVYFGFVKKQTTSDDYLLGGRRMSAVPISMSLIASVISGITLLAIPTDVYTYGVTYWFCVPMFALSCLMTYCVYMPVFYNLQVTSTFEYLKLRFGTTVRSFASAIFVFHCLLYLPVVIYIPALALSQATGISIHIITPIICGVCIFYTSFGGLKAVVWTDALQFFVMVGSIIAAFVLGIASGGGWGNIWQKNLEYGRLNVSFSTDITQRDTFWTASIGLTINWITYYTYNQGFVQKCIALPNHKSVRNAFIIFAIGTMTILSLSIFTGLIMFARYSNCDPLISRKIEQRDQLLPYYIMDVARVVPGLPGLFTAGIFSAGLSTLSAVINSLCASIYEDFISRYVAKDVSQEVVSNYLKMLAVIIGVIVTCLTYLIPFLGTLAPLAVTLGSISGGVLLGLFTSAMLIPAINGKFLSLTRRFLDNAVFQPSSAERKGKVAYGVVGGALYGGLASLVCTGWMVLGAQYYKSIKTITYPTLPLSIDGCQNFTGIFNSTMDTHFHLGSEPKPFILYRITFYYYSLIGTMIVIIVGLVVSKFTPRYNRLLKKEYFSPVIRELLKTVDDSSDYDSLAQIEKLSEMEEKP